MQSKKTPRILAMLLIIVLLAGCGAQAQTAQATGPETAEKTAGASASAAPAKAKHSVAQKAVTTYVGSVEDTLSEPFPLYFADGVEDLPYVELRDWAELFYFLYREYQNDPGYALKINLQ